MTVAMTWLADDPGIVTTISQYKCHIGLTNQIDFVNRAPRCHVIAFGGHHEERGTDVTEYSGHTVDLVAPLEQVVIDEYGSRRHPEQIAGLVSGPSQLEIMPGVRHVPHREQEEWVVRRVAHFLAAISR